MSVYYSNTNFNVNMCLTVEKFQSIVPNTVSPRVKVKKSDLSQIQMFVLTLLIEYVEKIYFTLISQLEL